MALISALFGINASKREGHDLGVFGPLAKVAQIVVLPPTVWRCKKVVHKEFVLSKEWCVTADVNFNSLETAAAAFYTFLMVLTQLH